MSFICKLLYHRVGGLTLVGLQYFRFDPVWPMIEICFLAFGEVLEPPPLLRGLAGRLFCPPSFLPAGLMAGLPAVCRAGLPLRLSGGFTPRALLNRVHPVKFMTITV